VFTPTFSVTACPI